MTARSRTDRQRIADRRLVATGRAHVPAGRAVANYSLWIMGRLCERPGCSERAALVYGMRPEDLVFWLDVLRDGTSSETGVLCQRHGDSITVPLGWTLDDLRDPELHLFRPPVRPDGPATRSDRPRRRVRSSDETGQLVLGGDLEARSSDENANEQQSEEVPEPASSGALDWKPAFDDGDDLDGLLAARSPLLSRAFRGERGQ